MRAGSHASTTSPQNRVWLWVLIHFCFLRKPQIFIFLQCWMKNVKWSKMNLGNRSLNEGFQFQRLHPHSREENRDVVFFYRRCSFNIIFRNWNKCCWLLLFIVLVETEITPSTPPAIVVMGIKSWALILRLWWWVKGGERGYARCGYSTVAGSPSIFWDR